MQSFFSALLRDFVKTTLAMTVLGIFNIFVVQ